MKPFILFLLETKKWTGQCDERMRVIGMTTAFYMPPIGIRGGLTIWWREDVEVDILYHDKNIIDCKVHVEDEGQNMNITWVYEDSNFSNRIKN